MMSDDELSTLKRLAGITNSFKGQTEYTIPTIENMSYTAAAVTVLSFSSTPTVMSKRLVLPQRLRPARWLGMAATRILITR